MRGRKPVPTQLKILHGNPGHRPLNLREPKPKRAVPPCPKELDTEARREWRRITRELKAVGLISRLDRAALASYCAAWSRFLSAQTELAKSGPVVKSPSGFPILNPYLSVLNAAVKQLNALLAELGLSPAARTRIRAEPPESPSELDQFTRDRSLSFQEPG